MEFPVEKFLSELEKQEAQKDTERIAYFKNALDPVTEYARRGPMQDFTDAVKEAKQTGKQRVEFKYIFQDIGILNGEVAHIIRKEKTIDVGYIDVTEQKLLP